MFYHVFWSPPTHRPESRYARFDSWEALRASFMLSADCVHRIGGNIELITDAPGSSRVNARPYSAVRFWLDDLAEDPRLFMVGKLAAWRRLRAPFTLIDGDAFLTEQLPDTDFIRVQHIERGAVFNRVYTETVKELSKDGLKVPDVWERAIEFGGSVNVGIVDLRSEAIREQFVNEISQILNPEMRMFLDRQLKSSRATYVNCCVEQLTLTGVLLRSGVKIDTVYRSNDYGALKEEAKARPRLIHAIGPSKSGEYLKAVKDRVDECAGTA